jgi:hypothetical protein
MVGNITANMPANWDYGAYANYVDERLSDCEFRYFLSLRFVADALTKGKLGTMARTILDSRL